MTNAQAQQVLNYLKRLPAPDYRAARREFYGHLAEYSALDRQTIASIFKALDKQKMSVNPCDRGPQVHYCDYGHTDKDVRVLKTSAGNIFLCKEHYDVEAKARKEQGVVTPAWEMLPKIKNPMRYDTQKKLQAVAAEHLKDAGEHLDPIAKGFDTGVASGIGEAIQTAQLENPRHPYEYAAVIMDYGGSRRVNYRLIGAISRWAIKHGFKFATKEYLYEQMKNVRIGSATQFGDGPRRLVIAKRLRKDAERNPKFVSFKPKFKRWDYYVEFLEETFIPDLEESGSPYALDFRTIVSMIKSSKLYPSDLEYIDWLKTTLIPDTIESGKISTAHDLQEGLYWIALGPGHGTRIQHKPTIKNPAGDPYKCDFATEERKARGMTMDELNYALIDAMKATRGANPDKYYDQASVYRKELLRRERKGMKNPVGGAPVEGAELIGTDCLAVEYKDVPKAKREGIPNPERPWRHDFEVPGTKIWGLPDGRVLLDGPKPLWRSQPNSVTGK